MDSRPLARTILGGVLATLVVVAPPASHVKAIAARGDTQVRLGLSGVAVDAQGNLYVTEIANHRVLKLSPAGEPLAQSGTRGTGPGQLYVPNGVAVDGQGNSYVADQGNDRVQ